MKTGCGQGTLERKLVRRLCDPVPSTRTLAQKSRRQAVTKALTGVHLGRDVRLGWITMGITRRVFLSMPAMIPVARCGMVRPTRINLPMTIP